MSLESVPTLHTDPREQTAIAVLTSGGSFADAMNVAHLTYDQVAKLWDGWSKSRETLSAADHQSRPEQNAWRPTGH